MGADAGGAGDRCVIRRSMALTREEFLRTLPSVLDGAPYRIENAAVVIESPAAKSLVIALRSVPERRLGALTLPVLEVEMVFRGYGDAERARFLERFGRRFQRGGG